MRQNKLDPSLLTGAPSIDDEHYALIKLLDRLKENSEAEPGSESFSEIFSLLGRQIATHMDNEEKLFRSSSMPAEKMAHHVWEHNEILEQCAKMNMDLLEGKLLIRSDVLTIVKGWIISHIEEHDTKIGQYLRNR